MPIRKPKNQRHRSESGTGTVRLALAALLAAECAAEAAQPYLTNSGQYSPFDPVEEHRGVPSKCEVSQVNLLQRHGARQPTSDAGKSIRATLAKIAGKGNYSRSEMNFLAKYSYDVGDDEDLIPYGSKKSYHAGKQLVRRMKCNSATAPLTFCSAPFVRVKGHPRVADSAGNWSRGYMGVQVPTLPNSYNKYFTFSTQFIFMEGEHLQDPLANNCPNLASTVPTAQEQWRAVWAPAVLQRLQDTRDYNLTASYDSDLGKYYGNAYPRAPLALSQGVGWVNELPTRLTSDRSYIDNDTTQFIYADFTYDNQLLPVMGLIGLFQDAPLSPTLPCPMRTFVASKMAPFAGRLVVERLRCSGSYEDGFFSFLGGDSAYVRILVNEQAMDLSSVCGKGATLTSGTVCRLPAFLSDGEGDCDRNERIRPVWIHDQRLSLAIFK